MASDINLELKPVNEIEGTFIIPSYQRGYRWGENEVTRLLEDIYENGANSYCLQPIVIRKTEEGFELIDGQQRLTTLYILLKYIQKEYKPRIPIKFSLEYKTRTKSKEYLNSFDEKLADSNIDFYHIYHAREYIDHWFRSKPDEGVVAADDIYGYLVKYVKVIWYEVSEDEDPIALFTRLNIGKIQLTSAELVKALFLCSKSNNLLDQEKQAEIAFQWDNIEKELNNDSFLCFLSNKKPSDYQTKIDIVLDLMAEKKQNDREKYSTFFHFSELRKIKDLDEVWDDIQRSFLILKDWYEDRELYHKIGYLIASEYEKISLQEIFNESQKRNTSDFKNYLDEKIKESIAIKKNYGELSYQNSTDYKNISRLLLLFNVESVLQIKDRGQRFPFDKFKSGDSDNVTWSLEHIHAQQSEGLKTKEQWKKWLELHIPSVKSLGNANSELLNEMQKAYSKENLGKDEFTLLQEKVVQLLSVQGNTEYLHSISNLALLKSDDNAALNNSTFDVKRNEIIKMDKEGKYIPFCTKMVFLKYYTPSEKTDLHFWGQADRIAYVKSINTVLKKYLNEEIELEKEEI